jgi:autotransporter-associated beta strand protein
MYLNKKIKKSSLKVLASIACFTAGSQALWGSNYYVTSTTETGTPTTDCPSTGDYSNCTISGNSCCTFLDAIQNVNSSGGNVFIPAGGVTYTNSTTEPYELVTGTAFITTSGGTGEVIDFAGYATVDFGVSLQIDSTVFLDNVVFQNTGDTGIFLAGGTLVINGTSINSGADTFTNVNMGVISASVLQFSTSSYSEYTEPFPCPIVLGAGQENSTLAIVNYASTVTLSGAISMSDTGTLLTIFPIYGTLNFTGDITVENVNINNYSSSTIFAATNNISDLTLYGGPLTVSGTTTTSRLDVIGSTTLTISGTMDVTGVLYGSDGQTLTLAGSGTKSIGTVNVDSQQTFTITGGISTGQNLTKTGSGILILNGASSTYTGTTNVDDGALVVNQAITTSSAFNVGGVGSGAILLGTGSVSSTTVASGSVIKGGTEFGTLSVTGTLDLQEGSYLATAIAPGNVSLVAATGEVTIGSDVTLLLATQPGTYSNNTATILTGSSITGEFSSVDVNGNAANFLAPRLTYYSTYVTLGLEARSVANLAVGGNAIQVADGLDGAIAYNRANVSVTISPASSSLELGAVLPNGVTLVFSPTPQLFDVLKSLISFTTEEEMTYALNQLHPAQLKGMAISQENNAVRVREALSQRMLNDLDADNCEPSNSYHKKDTSCCEKEKRMITTWVGGLGDTLKQDNKNGSNGPLTGYRTNTGGAVAGIDFLFADFFYGGALGGYTNSNLNFEDGKGEGSISSGYAGVYFSILGPQLWGSGFLGDLFFANASVIGSWSEYRADRHIEYTGVNLTAKNHHGGNQLLAHFDTGLNFNWWGLTVRPFDSFDYMTQIERKYHEHNAGQWDLTVQKKNMMMLRNELGLQFAKCYCTDSSKWIVSPKFSWVREVRVKGDSMNVKFTEGGTQFTIHGYFPDRNLFVPGLALTGFMLEDALVFDLYYNGEFTGGYSSNSFGGQIGYSF